MKAFSLLTAIVALAIAQPSHARASNLTHEQIMHSTASPPLLDAAPTHTLADVAASDPAPETPMPARLFGGCNRKGTFCAGPSALIAMSAYNLHTRSVEPAFAPGLGYGVTLRPREWYAFGADAYVSMDAGSNSISIAVIAKFANYVRAGVARVKRGDSWQTIIPVGVGLDL